MRTSSNKFSRFMKALALGSAIAVSAVGLPFVAAAPASADPLLTVASPTANTYKVTKQGSSYKISLDLNDSKYANKTVMVYITRVVYGQKLVVASRTVKLGAAGVGSTTTTRKVKAGDTIKVTKGALIVFTRKITSVAAGDTVAPTLGITDNVTGTATGPINYTFTFSEAVTGFSVDDIAVVGGTKGTLTGSGTTYGLTVTPAADSTAAVTVDVAAGGASDAAGNKNLAATQSVQSVNTHNPAVVITDDNAGTIHANDQVIFTFTFNQPVTGFDASDVVLAHGNKGAFVALSPTTYTLVATAANNFSGNMTVDVPAGVATSATNSATNLAAVQASQAVNTSNPTVTITDNNGGTVNAGQTVTYTFTWSEAVSGFTTGDVVVTGGTKGAFTATTALVYTLVVTPNDASNTAITVDIAAAAGTSVANGNPTAVAVQSVQPVDTRHPSVTITDNYEAVAGGDITFTFTFSEAVNGFVVGDINIVGGTKGAFTAVSSSVYTLVVTPSVTSATTVTADVAAGVATAALTANPNAAAVQDSQAANTGALVVSISDNNSGTVLAGQTVTYTFIFNKNVGSTFTGADLTVTGGTAGSVTEVTPGIKYTVVVTPTDGSTTDIALSVGTGVTSTTYTLASTSATAQPVDTVHPSVTITQGTLTSGTVTVTFTFSEGVTGFSAAGVTVGVAGTKSTFTAVSATVYTLVITSATTSTTVDVAANAATGVTHTNGNSAPAQYVVN